jgi:hypothetical protein
MYTYTVQYSENYGQMGIASVAFWGSQIRISYRRLDMSSSLKKSEVEFLKTIFDSFLLISFTT